MEPELYKNTIRFIKTIKCELIFSVAYTDIKIDVFTPEPVERPDRSRSRLDIDTPPAFLVKVQSIRKPVWMMGTYVDKKTLVIFLSFKK